MTLKLLLRDIDISDFIKQIIWSGHAEKSNRTLEISLINTVDGRNKAFAVNNGDTIQFSYNGQRLFVGTVFSSIITTEGDHSVTCFDRNVYLVKSTTKRLFKNKKASDIIKLLAKDFGIPIGIVEDTGYIIPILHLRNNTLYDMMWKALTLSRKQNGKRFFLTSVDGKLTCRQHKNNVTPWILAAGSNLTSASYSTSIEETKTQVQVVGGKDDKFTHTAKSVSSQKLFGIMQHYEEMDEKTTLSQVKQRADTLLKEMNVINDIADVSAIGIIDVITGCGVYVREPMTGLTGGYYVSSDDHVFTEGMHTMNLKISKSLEMPVIEISDEELGIEKVEPKKAVKKVVKKVAKK